METQPKALIAFCTLTGNTEEIATRLSEELEKCNVEAKVEDIMVASAKDFLKYDICAVATYSFDTGDDTVPQEAMDFFEDLGNLDLTGKIYGVLGSGQEDIYEHFCGAADRFEEQFKISKATRVSDPVKIDFNISSEEDEQKIRNLAGSLVNGYSTASMVKL